MLQRLTDGDRMTCAKEYSRLLTSSLRIDEYRLIYGLVHGHAANGSEAELVNGRPLKHEISHCKVYIAHAIDARCTSKPPSEGSGRTPIGGCMNGS